jgi:hypothetical protein
MIDFYDIIDAARGRPLSPLAPSADPDRLARELEKLDDGDLLTFGVAFNAELFRLNRWPIWDAGYVAAGGMSDDSFHYFRSWLIGKGRTAVDQVLSDPDGLVDFLDDAELDNELLEYVAIELLEERGVGPDPRDSSDESADGEPAGEKTEDADALDAAWPRLAAWRNPD